MSPYSLEMLWPVLAVGLAVTLGVVTLSLAAGRSRGWAKRRTQRWLTEAEEIMQRGPAEEAQIKGETAQTMSAAVLEQEREPREGNRQASRDAGEGTAGKVGAWEF